MHNLFANASELTFDSDGWITFWQSIYELESSWPENTGEILGLFLSLGKSFIQSGSEIHYEIRMMWCPNGSM